MKPERIVQRAKKGDERARSEIVRRYQPGIFSLAKKLTRNEETAREVAQETFLRAFAHIDQFQGKVPIRSWLYKIATNYIRDHFRRGSRWESSMEEPAGETTPETILQRREDLGRVRAALDPLPPLTRASMILHLQESMSIKEISFVLDISTNAVRMKIYRGLQLVRQEVRKKR